jgi:eukaryotic-like serine/threonine-protein kinase
MRRPSSRYWNGDIQRLLGLRNRASDRERFYIETLYDRDFTGNLERERRTLETWAESYPRDASAHNLLAGLALSSTGQHELAVAETEKAIALDPDLAPAYANRAFNQLMLNRLDDALLTVRLSRRTARWNMPAYF